MFLDGNSDTPGGMSRRHNARNEMLAFKNELKDLLGAYLSKRKESKYEIIETVMKMVVFGDGKVDEIKFLDEALKHTSHSDVQNNLQRYMKKKGMLLSQGTVKKANPKNEETKKPEVRFSKLLFRMANHIAHLGCQKMEKTKSLSSMKHVNLELGMAMKTMNVLCAFLTWVFTF